MQVWRFGVRAKEKRVSRREFIRGYTHIIKSKPDRQKLCATVEHLLGGCFDVFDDTLHGERKGSMTKQDFVSYQMCWNLAAEEAEHLFRDITDPPQKRVIDFESTDVGKPDLLSAYITREQYLNGAFVTFRLPSACHKLHSKADISA
jgi:hypothetical protein